jgi:hypothetical protein
MMSLKIFGLLALVAVQSWTVSAQAKVKIMTLGDSITGSPASVIVL